MAQKFGIATIAANGRTFNTEPGASLDIGGITRETETTDQQSDYVESRRPAMVKCRIPLNRGVSLVDLNDIVGASIQFITDTGQSYVLANSWRVGALEVSGGSGGGMDLEFHAPTAIEVGV
ncbi:MAG: phage tail tube protein [Pseudomonadota bacterium]